MTGNEWPRRLATLLTSRGWGLIVAMTLTAVAAGIFGIGELYPVAAAGFALILYAVAWSWRRSWRIDVGRRLKPSRVEAGQGATVVITLRNRSTTSSPVLTLRDPFDGGRPTTQMVVAPLRAGEELSGSYQLPRSARGVFALGPLTLEAIDPFGLARRVRSSGVVSTFVVHPRVERLRPPRVGAGSDLRRGAAFPVPGRDNDEFASLREYREGDDIRRMHWASTARTDTLMVREDQLERRGQWSVILDCRRDSWSAASFERAVSAAASITSAALDGGLHSRVLTTDGADTGYGTGRSHRSKMLDMLAETRTASAPAGAAGPEKRAFGAAPLPSDGSVILISSERADTDDLCRAAGASMHIDLTVLLIGRPTSGGGQVQRRPAPGVSRVVLLGAGTEMATAWDRFA